MANAEDAAVPPVHHQAAWPRRLAGLIHDRPLRWRFRLRTLLLLSTTFSVALGLETGRMRDQAKTVAELKRRGGNVVYDTHRVDTEPARFRSWVGKRIGRDWCCRVIAVHFNNGARVTDSELALVARLRSVEAVVLAWDQQEADVKPTVTAAGLKQLDRLPKLQRIALCGKLIGRDQLALALQPRSTFWTHQLANSN